MTCSAAELEKIRRDIFLALFIALAVLIHTLEALLPSPIMGLRPGFANILSLTALFLYDAAAAWTVTLARILIGSLLLGNLFSPGFLLSLAGGVTALAIMTPAKALGGPAIGPVGVSALGAVGHICAQLVVASWLLMRHAGLWHLAPAFLSAALITGIINGLATALLLENLRHHPVFGGQKTSSDTFFCPNR